MINLITLEKDFGKMSPEEMSQFFAKSQILEKKYQRKLEEGHVTRLDMEYEELCSKGKLIAKQKMKNRQQRGYYFRKSQGDLGKWVKSNGEDKTLVKPAKSKLPF
jgi:hypothetical protein